MGMADNRLLYKDDTAGINIFHRSKLNDLAQVHNGDKVGYKPDNTQVVGNKDEGGTELILYFIQQVKDRGLYRYIKSRYWFVTDNQVGLTGNGAGNADTLFFTPESCRGYRS